MKLYGLFDANGILLRKSTSKNALLQYVKTFKLRGCKVVRILYKENPLGPYKDFAECQRSSAKKGVRDTGAYCGAIERAVRKGAGMTGKTRRKSRYNTGHFTLPKRKSNSAWHKLYEGITFTEATKLAEKEKRNDVKLRKFGGLGNWEAIEVRLGFEGPGYKKYDVWGKPLERKNPQHSDSLRDAEAVAAGFHGKAFGELEEILEPEVYPENLAKLGWMDALELEGYSDAPIQFTELPLSKRALLCASSDADQLYIVGPQKLTEADLKFFGVEYTDRDFVEVGKIETIAYITEKHHLSARDKKLGPYGHKFGEEGGELPTLVYDCLNDRCLIVGGSYTIADEGIRN